MKFFSKIKDALNEPNLDDVHWYARVEEEMESGLMRNGLWTKALADANFDTQRAKAIYVKLAVASLKQEARDSARLATNAQAESIRIAANAQVTAMKNAINLYNEGHYAAAMDGLLLLVERNNDDNAKICLGNILWGSLGGQNGDGPRAMQLFNAAEASQNPDVRRFLGQSFEHQGDWERALRSYDFSARNGNQLAKQLAKNYRDRLKERGVIKKSIWDKMSR